MREKHQSFLSLSYLNPGIISIALGEYTANELHNSIKPQIFINNLDDRMQYALSKLVDHTKLEWAIDILRCRTAIQQDLNRLEKVAGMNFMKFSKDKYQVLSLRWNNPTQQSSLIWTD